MPIYTYTCEECGAEVDVQSTISERNAPKRQAHPRQPRQRPKMPDNVRDEIDWQETQRCLDVIDQVLPATCGGQLVRSAVELTCRTPEKWRP